MRVTQELKAVKGRVATHAFPPHTTPEVIAAYTQAIEAPLKRVRETALSTILEKPVANLPIAEQAKFDVIGKTLVPYFYRELGQGHHYMPDFEMDYSTHSWQVTTDSGLKGVSLGWNNHTIGISHVTVERGPGKRGDMLDILLTSAHEWSHRFTYGGPFLFWRFAKELSVSNAEKGDFGGVRTGEINGLQFSKEERIVVGQALENGMAARDSRNVYEYVANAVNTPLSSDASAQTLSLVNAPKFTQTEEDNIRTAKKFEEEVVQRKAYMATDAFRADLEALNARVRERLGARLTIQPTDVEPFLWSHGDAETFSIKEISLLSYILARLVAQRVGVDHYPRNTTEEQVAFGWSMLQESRLRNPKNAYHMIVHAFGPEKSRAIFLAREESPSILDALAKLV